MHAFRNSFQFQEKTNLKIKKKKLSKTAKTEETSPIPSQNW